MLKKYKNTLIVTTLVLLIPIIVGLLLWNKLPEQVPSHWDINGNVDAWSSKFATVFGVPAFLIALQWLCAFATQADPKSKDFNPKIMKLVLWICPSISLVVTTFVYIAALGYEPKVEVIMPLLVGVLFLITGNLMPKFRHSYTMGIKLPWTLNSEENWNKTHRFASRVWVVGGLAIMVTRNFWLMLAIILAMVIIPTFYSYLYYRNHERNNEHGN